MDNKLKSPVLLILFNRPAATAKVFERIRQAAPERLYLAADGPRADHAGDPELCAQARGVAEQVDWPCRVETHFQEVNLGCGRGVVEAINWFFANESEGLILEDDCLPHMDFFRFSDWALETYRNERKVWHIGGSNFQAPKALFKGKSIGFSPLAEVWGWATWKNRWEHYTFRPSTLRLKSRKQWLHWPLSIGARLVKYHHLRKLQNGLDTWDYQWQILLLNQHALALYSAANLISNIGTGPDSTHTKIDCRAFGKTQSMEGSLVAESPILNRPLTRHLEANMGLRSWRQRFKAILSFFIFRANETD